MFSVTSMLQVVRRSPYMKRTVVSYAEKVTGIASTRHKNTDAIDTLLDPTLGPDDIHNRLLQQAKRSVLVEMNGRPGKKLDQDMKTYMKTFGNIEYFSCLKTLPNKSRYLLEFQSPKSVTDLLNKGKDGAIENRMIEVGTGNTNNESDAQAHLREDNDLDLKNLLNRQDTMDDQIQLTADRFIMNSDGVRVRYLFHYIVNQVFYNRFKNYLVLKPFGSSLTGAGMSGSDLDIGVLSKDYEQGNVKPFHPQHSLIDYELDMKCEFSEEAIKILKEADDLISSGLEVEKAELLLNAKIPILTFHYPILDLSVDITVNQYSGRNFYNIINWYIRYDRRVAPVLLVIRKWAESRSLLSHGFDYDGFTPFMLQMVVLQYLIRVDVLPPAYKFSRIIRSKLIMNGTPASRIRKRTNVSLSPAELVYGFFKYFGDCGLMGLKFDIFGGTIKARNHRKMKVWIKNPFTLHFNVAQNCSSANVVKMEQEIKKSATLLKLRKEKLADRNWGVGALLFGK